MGWTTGFETGLGLEGVELPREMFRQPPHYLLDLDVQGIPLQGAAAGVPVLE